MVKPYNPKMCHVYSKNEVIDMKVAMGEEIHAFFMGFMKLMPIYASKLYLCWHEGAFRGRTSYEVDEFRMAFYESLRTICCAEMSKKLVKHFFRGHGASNEADRLIFKLCDMTVRKYVSDIGYEENRNNKRSGSAMRMKLQKRLTARIKA